MVATPRSLLFPVVPPETGYAIVNAGGSVFYHSNRERILNENLFRETEDPKELVDAIATRAEKGLHGSYRGRDVMFYVQPVREIAGIPWTIVVFRDMEPLQALVWQVCLNVLKLYLVDPMFHFDSIFPDQKEEVERNPLPETEFGSWAHILLQFERVLAVDDEQAPEWATEDWSNALWEECRHHRWLRRTCQGGARVKALIQHQALPAHLREEVPVEVAVAAFGRMVPESRSREGRAIIVADLC